MAAITKILTIARKVTNESEINFLRARENYIFRLIGLCSIAATPILIALNPEYSVQILQAEAFLIIGIGFQEIL